MINYRPICEALRDAHVTGILCDLLRSSYQTHFSHEQAHTWKILDMMMQSLVRSQRRGIDTRALRDVGRSCHQRYFSPSHAPSWFVRGYERYRKHHKPRYEFLTIRSHIRGRSILDFGCGDGLFAGMLMEHGYRTTASDVIDYHESVVPDRMFELMGEPGTLSHLTHRVDTTIVKTVLHHVRPSLVPHLLSQIRLRTRHRIILKEDILIPKSDHGLLRVSRMVDHVRAYLDLTPSRQRRVLALLDFIGNYVVLGRYFIDIPCNFRSLSTWRRLLAVQGITLIEVVPTLFDRHMLHDGPQVWLICDVHPGRV